MRCAAVGRGQHFRTGDQTLNFSQRTAEPWPAEPARGTRTAAAAALVLYERCKRPTPAPLNGHERVSGSRGSEKFFTIIIQ
ncbi:hypothetical protein chiPu_0020655 [Chiloscyllium punctatum]|uniref:Uncharacterized protein n=1 Tax=Chiloscyllium punctatum TaxID=137246 RepID=A0A401RHZ6_CHIPU|nr:hypothetical protein [Chiloscyllium punctatum]